VSGDQVNTFTTLPEGETVPVEYEFACQMGMLRARVIVQ